MSPVLAWLENECVLQVGSSVASSVALTLFHEWCKREGMNEWKASTFGKALAAAVQPHGASAVRVVESPVRSEAATKPRGVQKRVMRRAPTMRSRTAGEAGEELDMVASAAAGVEPLR
jgi:hypothetical protein